MVPSGKLHLLPCRARNLNSTQAAVDRAHLPLTQQRLLNRASVGRLTVSQHPPGGGGVMPGVT
jgi:hypothetical protein